MTIGENRVLIRDPVVDHGDHCETAHRWHLDQRILHRWIAEVLPLLQQVDSQHRPQRVGRPAMLVVLRLWVRSAQPGYPTK